MYAILTRLGGVRTDDARLLTDATAARRARRAGRPRRSAPAAKSRGDETVLLVYYSGHAKDGDLRLGDTRMPLAELRDALRAAPADVRIGLLDSCQSGAITRGKGVRPAPAFDVQQAAQASTAAAWAGADRLAPAPTRSRRSPTRSARPSSPTTWPAGLLGDADASGDGKVTLAEAYAYAYARTVGETAETAGGRAASGLPLRPGRRGRRGPHRACAGARRLVFPAAPEGVYVVLDGSRRAVAEVAKARGDPRRLALAPGEYMVKKRDGDSLLVGDVSVADGAGGDRRRAPVAAAASDDPQKGASGPRCSAARRRRRAVLLRRRRRATASSRRRRWPASELAARDDLGHELAWGLDLALGGGASTLQLPGVVADPRALPRARPAAPRSGATSTSADSLTALPGRAARLHLPRRGTFPDHPELPAQNFFTLTPGPGDRGLTWRFARALVRGGARPGELPLLQRRQGRRTSATPSSPWEWTMRSVC